VTAARRAVLVESFLGGSHDAFARGWIARSRHEWRLVGLPAASWKWRMRLAAWPLGRRLTALRFAPDAVVATGLIDLAHLRQASGATAEVPFLLYLHENQLSYPRPPGRPLDRGFAVAHIASLLAADAVAFNSRAHRDAMAAEVRRFLDDVPSPRPTGVSSRIGRASILRPGVDLDGFPAPAPRQMTGPPVVLWNHRWEEDKRPSAFARVMIALADEGVDFRLVLLGTGDQVQPTPLLLLRERLADRILRDKPAVSRAEYVHWLARADVAVSTAEQENFGYAAIEAMAAGAVPLLPSRLSYPEITPDRLHGELLYDTDAELREKLGAWLREPGRFLSLREAVMRSARSHEWSKRVGALDRWVGRAIERRAGAVGER
jgi:glycosyltransferase involved in cell wall biosynthesis